VYAHVIGCDWPCARGRRSKVAGWQRPGPEWSACVSRRFDDALPPTALEVGRFSWASRCSVAKLPPAARSGCCCARASLVVDDFDPPKFRRSCGSDVCGRGPEEFRVGHVIGLTPPNRCPRLERNGFPRMMALRGRRP